MTKRQTRLFFYVSTALFAAIFLALTVDTQRQIPALTHADQITPAVLRGQEVWHRKNCTNCHTLLGEGAYYAPDLTKIAQQRGAAYLHQFLKNPATFYSEQRDRRLMPTLGLSDGEIDDVVAFLTWISHIDTQGWPPRPILVSGGAVPAAFGGGAAAPASNDPVALGEALFRAVPPGCVACHSTTPGVTLVGPSLAGIATRAATRLASPDYHGHASSAAAYVRESILDPNAYVVAGPTFSADGKSLMPPNFGATLRPDQVDDLVAYLMTLK
jgi:nitric oxide reductase subunit C